MLLENEVGREITSWSVELGDGDLALIRYTQYIDEDAPTPDADALDAAVVEMVRGWAPAVEAELIDAAGAAARDPARARPTSTPSPTAIAPAPRPRKAPPTSFGCASSTTTATAPSASRASTTDAPRPAAPEDLPPRRAHPAVRRGAGAREFRLPRARGNADRARAAASAISTISASRSAREADIDAILARVGEIERAIANVLCGAAEDDEFNQLVLYAGLDTQAGGLAARLVPLSAPDRKQLRPGHRRRCAAPRARTRRAR